MHPACREEARREQEAADKERERAVQQWARSILAMPTALILDTETTSLDGEIVEVAIIDVAGNERLNTRLRPATEIETDASRIHGLTADMLANEPLFTDVYDELNQLLISAETVIIYNRAFDVAILNNTCRIHGVPVIVAAYECAMLPYAEYVGEWNDYYGNYRWHPLPGGDHSAVGDCRATLELLHRMAGVSAESPA